MKGCGWMAMRPKMLLLLAGMLLPLAVAAGVMMDWGGKGTRHSRLGQHPFAGWPVERASVILLTRADGVTTLKREDPIWIVEERYGYPADFARIRDLVQRISDCRLGSTFQVFPDTLDRLHLHDPAAPNVPAGQKGLRVIFQDAQDRPLLDVLLGRPRAGMAGGHYVMPSGSSVGYLVDRDFRSFGGRPWDWIERELLDVQPEDIERVVCEEPATGQVLYTLRRPEPHLDPVWMDALPGYRVREGRVEAVFRALIRLGAEDVAGPVDDARMSLWEEPLPFLVYHLYDGTVYTLSPGPRLPDGDEHFALRIKVAYSAPSEDGFRSDASNKEAVDTEKAALAAERHARLAPWVYAIAAWRHGSLVLDPAEFVAAGD